MADDSMRYPLYWPVGWKRTLAHARRESDYRVSFMQARDHTAKQLKLLGVRDRDIVLSTNVPVRLDGLPYANMREPEDPGVAVYWTRRGEQRVIACDRWRKVRENLRAVGLALEAMRALERTGASEILDRAFAGFAALPASTAKGWRDVLGFPPGATVSSSMVESRYRELARQRHPDAGGSHESFVELGQAREEALREVRS